MLPFADMNRWLVSTVCVSFLSCTGAFAQASAQPGLQSGAAPCDQALHRAASLVLESQQKLLDQRVEDMSTEVPAELRQQITNFKDTLAASTDVILHCETVDTPAQQLETELAREFHANQKLPSPTNAGSGKAATRTPHGGYGADLKVSVSTSQAAPQLRLIDYQFGIECGDDSVLLVYEPGRKNAEIISPTGAKADSGMPDGFVRALRWQADPYDQISGAFGDFFQYVVLPGSDGKPWRLAVAHGMPWCTSTMSGFKMDLLDPQEGTAYVIWHDQETYRRGDFDPRMTLRGNGFELRAEVSTIELEQLVRKGIFRYDIDGDTAQRVQPIAVDGRGFVDAWLQAPWSEAKDWSLPEGLAGFEKAHEAFARSRKDSSVTYNYGPVRSCLMKGLYEVEIDADPGGPQFYAIREAPNGYTMVNFGTTQDERCTGPDLMKKQTAGAKQSK
jgi:hypothetical protein